MKLTKYEHACVVLEERGKRLVIDPGGFTDSFGSLHDIVAVVVTHQHPDHLNPEHLRDIFAANSMVQIFLPGDAAQQAGGLPIHEVTGSANLEVGPFRLQFFGQHHAEIHPSFPIPENVGVLINETVYYPGDSFTLPEMPVQLLLAPVSAPWLKIGETIDFVDAVKPKICVPTHNAILSSKGSFLTEKWLSGVCQQHGITYRHLESGESIEI